MCVCVRVLVGVFSGDTYAIICVFSWPVLPYVGMIIRRLQTSPQHHLSAFTNLSQYTHHCVDRDSLIDACIINLCI